MIIGYRLILVFSLIVGRQTDLVRARALVESGQEEEGERLMDVARLAPLGNALEAAL